MSGERSGPDSPSGDDRGQDPPPDRWRNPELWRRIGYAATALWMLLVLAMSDGNVKDPWFQFIFIVPLTGWIAGLVIANTVAALRRRRKS